MFPMGQLFWSCVYMYMDDFSLNKFFIVYETPSNTMCYYFESFFFNLDLENRVLRWKPGTYPKTV